MDMFVIQASVANLLNCVVRRACLKTAFGSIHGDKEITLSLNDRKADKATLTSNPDDCSITTSHNPQIIPNPDCQY